MKKIAVPFLFVIACLLTMSTSAQTSNSTSNQSRNYVWQIGLPDNNDTEFEGNGTFEKSSIKDGFFVVGKSNAGRDWPFVQPGPADNWAGNKPHTFSIVFGLPDAISKNGTYHLVIRLADVGTQKVNLLVKVNDHSYQKTLDNGNGQSIYSDLSNAKPVSLQFDVPASNFASGTNRIDITTETGSWLLYDWLALEAPDGIKSVDVKQEISILGFRNLPFIAKDNGRQYQAVRADVINTGDSANLVVKMTNMLEQKCVAGSGISQIEFKAPVVTKDSSISFLLQQNNKTLLTKNILLQPVTKMTVYILPHSHNDIGYTEIQTNVEKKQINNLLTGIEYAERTKNYPPGARFVWNLEGLYAADLFLHRMNKEQQQAFLKAVKEGGVALNGMYLNTLTGLCRPEELLQLFRYSTELAARTGTQIKSAMISDVPGYTWGTVSAMAQAGIRYFSAAPNNFDRIGDILETREDKPFWWVSASGKDKVLVWIPYKGYSLSHGLPGGLSKDFVETYINKLKEKKFPYDISYIRWSGHGDNATPDMTISDFVKDWSTKYEWPKFIISSTTTAFQAFENKYGNQIPTEQGDWTGYWEDGAGSSALETGENRNTSSRLSQAEALWAMKNPAAFPADSFHQAWRHVILYSEHSWGADESVTRPLSQKTMEQWIIKKSYATIADTLSEALLKNAVKMNRRDAIANAVDVYNTSSWTRTSLVKISAPLSAAGDVVKDETGTMIPSQRLSTGELAFVAKNVLPFSARRYIISAGMQSETNTGVQTGTDFLDNGIIRVQLDTATGAVKSLQAKGISNEFVDASGGEGINDYLFLPGNKLEDIQRINHVDISIKEKGPVLSTLLIRSEAPGCTKLLREVTLVKDFTYVELSNLLDKKPAELDPYPGDYGWANLKGKESLNIAFPFHVKDGEMKLEVPMGIVRPDKDQIAGSCRNWMEVNGWADVSNKDFGVTWVTLDAPLVEVRTISANLLGGQSNPAVWRKKIEPTQKLYSWALNNHWETNYRAYQQGPILFRYALQPHAVFNAAASTQLATGLAQPFVVAPAFGKPMAKPLVQLSSNEIVALALKPSADGKAWMLTLQNLSEKNITTNLQWSEKTGDIYYSSTAEDKQKKLYGSISLEPQEILTLRVERF